MAAVQWLDAACKQQSPTCLCEGPSIRTQHFLALEPCMQTLVAPIYQGIEAQKLVKELQQYQQRHDEQ